MEKFARQPMYIFRGKLKINYARTSGLMYFEHCFSSFNKTNKSNRIVICCIKYNDIQRHDSIFRNFVLFSQCY